MKSAQTASTAILLLNLGGPDSLEAVTPFLYNLFSDREIIRLGPRFLQRPIAWLISRLRSGKTRHMYRQIGGKSPILDITMAQAAALEDALNRRTETDGLVSKLETPDSKLSFRVYVGMRYWMPFIRDTVERILNDGVTDLIVLSLYPHYSKATTGSSYTDFERAAEGKGFTITGIREWYDFPPYIDSLAELMSEGLSGCGSDNLHILFSAHSLPQSFIDEGDPYLDQIKVTAYMAMDRLSEKPYCVSGLPWHLSFQSKTGPVKWLEPTTEETIIRLALEGCRNLFIVPVSFISDHIETLYEIDILYREMALKHGINLKRCGSLNTSEKFIYALKELIRTHARH